MALLCIRVPVGFLSLGCSGGGGWGDSGGVGGLGAGGGMICHFQGFEICEK